MFLPFFSIFAINRELILRSSLIYLHESCAKINFLFACAFPVYVKKAKKRTAVSKLRYF